jgi:hypothetical protein
MAWRFGNVHNQVTRRERVAAVNGTERSMRKTLRACVVALVITGASLSAVPAFGAATRTHAVVPAVTFTGRFKFFATIARHTATCEVDIKSNGTAVCETTRKVAHWSASGSNITIVYKGSPLETFKGTRTATGYGSKTHPGSFTIGSTRGTWYALGPM